VRVVDLHNRIVEAIRAANGGAWAAMRAHLEKFAAAMRIEPVGSQARPAGIHFLPARRGVTGTQARGQRYS
jgi:hypothetical protein